VHGELGNFYPELSADINTPKHIFFLYEILSFPYPALLSIIGLTRGGFMVSGQGSPLDPENIEKNCWEVNGCPEDIFSHCPAYPDFGRECWKVTGNVCGKGMYKKANVFDKLLYCRSECEYFKSYLDPAQ
jgi:hypothetical protein